jgi:hypothetical protein
MLRCTEVAEQTVALGQERLICGTRAMSAFTPKATE